MTTENQDMSRGHDECTMAAAEAAEDCRSMDRSSAWKVIIADDEEEVHRMTRLVLSDFRFKGRGLELLSAYSGDQAVRLLERHPDTAVLLLDVVMEADDDGLAAVHVIRRELKNEFVRIILRTGQPGKAPENRVITQYDINDYKEKTELTAQKLYTALTAALRGYRDLRIIEKNRRGLEQIIHASADLFEHQSLTRFAQGVLNQLLAILHLDNGSVGRQTAAFIASGRDDRFVISAATGVFQDCIGGFVDEVLPGSIRQYLHRAIAKVGSIFTKDMYIGYFATRKGSRHLLYLKGCRELTELDRKLIAIFAANVAIAFENIALNQEIVETQKEVIYTLGEVIESRSKETGNHVRRVAELSYLLARKAGLSAKDAELIRMASPMHDVGKVGIPDAILFKPARLNPEEFETVKHHTEIGSAILQNSQREIMQAAVTAARQHHERWDGSGYPDGLKEDEIHIYGRITALMDVFDALLHQRVYKAAWDRERVLEYIRQQRGARFDPRLTDILLAHADEFFDIVHRFPDGRDEDS